MAGISASPDDRENFNLLMRDLRAVLGPERLITVASSAYAEYNVIMWDEVAMSWDYAGDNEAGDLQKTLAKELL